MSSLKSSFSTIVSVACLVLLVAVFIKLDKVEEKVQKTNIHLYSQGILDSFEGFNTIQKEDIVIGEGNDADAIFVYIKHGCDACEQFYLETVDNGLEKKAKVVIRFLAHPSRKKRFQKTVNAYKAYKAGDFKAYMKNSFFEEEGVEYTNDSINFDEQAVGEYITATAKKARSFRINATPTTFYKGEKTVGSFGLKKFNW